MIYTEKKTLKGWEYFNEDLYGETIIKSRHKLEPDILDEIVCIMVMEKKIKKGHTDSIKFEATFKDQWENNNIKTYDKNVHILQRLLRWFKEKIFRKKTIR